MGEAVVSNMDVEELLGKLATENVQLRPGAASGGAAGELQQRIYGCSGADSGLH